MTPRATDTPRFPLRQQLPLHWNRDCRQVMGTLRWRLGNERSHLLILALLHLCLIKGWILIISKPVWPMFCVSHRCEIIVFREVWAWATASSFADRSSGICVQPMMGTGGRQGGIEFWASVEAQLVELLLLSRRGIDQVYSSRSSSSMYSMENWPGGSPANDQWPLPPNSHLTIPIQGKINQKGSSYETLNRGAHWNSMFTCFLSSSSYISRRCVYVRLPYKVLSL